MPGKMTAFDTDIHVPLVVMGPGVPAGAHTNAMAENIDLAKTFAAIGGTTLPSDGHSLLGLLHGDQPTDWRNAVLIEHHGPNLNPSDPDFQFSASGNPITYEAMRTDRFLYVEYVNGEREYYDLRSDPFELNNIINTIPPDELAALHEELVAIENCHDGPGCWEAMHIPGGSSVVTTQLRSSHLARRPGAGQRLPGAQLRHRGPRQPLLGAQRPHRRLRHLRQFDRKRRALHRHRSRIPFGDRRHNRQTKPRSRAL
jgi:hypothetical protein